MASGIPNDPATGALTIAVDGRSLGGGPGRGIAHYLRALVGAWPAADELRIVVPRGDAARVAADLVDAAARCGAAPARRGAPEDPDGGRCRVVVVEHALAGRLPYAAGALVGRPRLDVVAGGCDVAWVPAPAPVAVGAPYVLTVHDRSWEARPQDFTAYERVWHRVARPRRLARRAARVVTTTRWGRDDLLAAWDLDPARVAAVHLAPAVPTSRGESARGPVLFVGALEPRKGPDVLARAMELARPRGFDAPVVVVGAGREDALLRAPGVRPAAATVDDAALSRLYAGARALVVPSRLEGFGLPALEALAHGTPVVATDLPPVREVLGDAATYVPVDDPEALADALLDLPAPPPPRGPLHGRTWAQAAQETRAVLADAAGRTP